VNLQIRVCLMGVQGREQASAAATNDQNVCFNLLYVHHAKYLSCIGFVTQRR